MLEGEARTFHIRAAGEDEASPRSTEGGAIIAGESRIEVKGVGASRVAAIDRELSESIPSEQASNIPPPWTPWTPGTKGGITPPPPPPPMPMKPPTRLSAGEKPVGEEESSLRCCP